MSEQNKQYKDEFRHIAEQYLSQEHTEPWTDDESASQLVSCIYHSGLWDKGFRDRFPALAKKKISTIDEDDIRAYLTMVVCTDRTQEGCIDSHIRSGKLSALLRRWLEIQSETEGQNG